MGGYSLSDQSSSASSASGRQSIGFEFAPVTGGFGSSSGGSSIMTYLLIGLVALLLLKR